MGKIINFTYDAVPMGRLIRSACVRSDALWTAGRAAPVVILTYRPVGLA